MEIKNNYPDIIEDFAVEKALKKVERLCQEFYKAEAKYVVIKILSNGAIAEGIRKYWKEASECDEGLEKEKLKGYLADCMETYSKSLERLFYPIDEEAKVIRFNDKQRRRALTV